MHEHAHAPNRNSISHHFWLQASCRFKTGVNWCLAIRTEWALLQGCYMIASTKQMCSCRPIISCSCSRLLHNYLWLCDQMSKSLFLCRAMITTQTLLGTWTGIISPCPFLKILESLTALLRPPVISTLQNLVSQTDDPSVWSLRELS